MLESLCIDNLVSGRAIQGGLICSPPVAVVENNEA